MLPAAEKLICVVRCHIPDPRHTHTMTRVTSVTTMQARTLSREFGYYLRTLSINSWSTKFHFHLLQSELSVIFLHPQFSEN